MIPVQSLKIFGEIRRIFVMVLLFTFCGIALIAQKPDSINTGIDDQMVVLPDSTARIEKEEGHSPRKAMIYSIVLPGLGQAYNKKYWKIPIVYTALGGVGYAIFYNTKEYRLASEAYSISVETNSPDQDTNERYLRYWRRNLELSFIGLVVVDALAVVDAYVDANLFYWDVDPDLTIRMEPLIQPMLNPNGSLVNNYGFRCSITF